MSTAGEIREGAVIVTAGLTTPVLPGLQPPEKSIPAVITNLSSIPVEEVNKEISEVSSSMLGIPRAERQLALFADVTRYGVPRSEWSALRRNLPGDANVVMEETAVGSSYEHLPDQSAGQITSEAARSSSAFVRLSTKRNMRYQPGRVSGATFGVSMSVSADPSDSKKFGVFNSEDGYYFEVLGGLQTNQADQILWCVRRTSVYKSAITPGPSDVGTAGVDLVIIRDGLTQVHAGLYDNSLRVATGGFPISGSTITFSVPAEFRYVYEYRVPRKYFSYDRLDGLSNQTAFYSDVVPGGQPFTYTVSGSANQPQLTLTNGTATSETLDSVWNINFANVTMYRIEFSWYGAVGALFLAYVPDKNSPGDARWVKIHSMRASNQLGFASLGNPTLPMSYQCQRGSQTATWIRKFGASFYIDGGDEGTVVPRSYAFTGNASVTNTQSLLFGIQMRSTINNLRNLMQVFPFLLTGGTNGLAQFELVLNPTVTGSPTFTTTVTDTLSPIAVCTTPGAITLTGGRVYGPFWVNGALSQDLKNFFAYNKDSLTLPASATVGDTLWVRVRSQLPAATVTVNAALHWTEQI